MGKFVKGAWIEGCTEDMIGKKIVRTCPLSFPCVSIPEYYIDYSYSMIGMCGDRDAESECVILKEILLDGSLVIVRYPGVGPWNLSNEWNDGNWVLVEGMNNHV